MKKRNLQFGQKLQVPQRRRDGAGELITIKAPAQIPQATNTHPPQRRQTHEPALAIPGKYGTGEGRDVIDGQELL